MIAKILLATDGSPSAAGAAALAGFGVSTFSRIEG